MLNRSVAFLNWMVNLFNPPPLASMSRAQKIGRVFFVGMTLVIISILTAMIGAVALFLVERGRELARNIPQLVDGLEIIAVGFCVNVMCVMVLLEIRKADRKLIPPSEIASFSRPDAT